MTEALYERYKDALRRGHVAVLRGRFEQALTAYAEAAAIATERALPYTSMAGVHARVGRLDEALAAYDEALRRAPRDEGALIGRADVLVRANRRAEGAALLDLASEIQEQAGRPGEALDTARRALELAESKARRRHVAGLVRELRQVSGLDQEAELALAKALRLLEPPEVPEVPPEAQAPEAQSPAATPEAPSGPGKGRPRAVQHLGTGEEGGEAGVQSDSVAVEPRQKGAAEAGTTGDSEVRSEGAAESPGPVEAATEAESATGAEAAVEPEVEAELPDPFVLRTEADVALEAGDPARACRALLDAARAHAAQGQYDAALDACHLALVVAPDDPEVHLELVDLYLRRGWHETAAEKLLLLDRLLALEGDEASRARVRAIVVAAFPDEPSLAALRS